MVGGLAPETADLTGAAALAPPRIKLSVLDGKEARQVGLWVMVERALQAGWGAVEDQWLGQWA